MTETLTEDDVSWGQCERAVEEELPDVSGVTDVEADREDGRATVEEEADVATLVGAAERVGYPAHA